MLKLYFIFTLIVLWHFGSADQCDSDDKNIQFLCRHNLLELYNDQLANATARNLYRSHLLDLLLTDSRPSCFAYEFGSRIFEVKAPNFWKAMWIQFKSDSQMVSEQPCREIATMLQTTFARYGGMTFSQLETMSNDLLQKNCACQEGDIQCQADFPSILYLLWNDPDSVGIYDLDGAWANNDSGALRLLAMIQRDHTWSRFCPRMH